MGEYRLGVYVCARKGRATGGHPILVTGRQTTSGYQPGERARPVGAISLEK